MGNKHSTFKKENNYTSSFNMWRNNKDYSSHLLKYN